MIPLSRGPCTCLTLTHAASPNIFLDVTNSKNPNWTRAQCVQFTNKMRAWDVTAYVKFYHSDRGAKRAVRQEIAASLVETRARRAAHVQNRGNCLSAGRPVLILLPDPVRPSSSNICLTQTRFARPTKWGKVYIIYIILYPQKLYNFGKGKRFNIFACA